MIPTSLFSLQPVFRFSGYLSLSVDPFPPFLLQQDLLFLRFLLIALFPEGVIERQAEHWRTRGERRSNTWTGETGAKTACNTTHSPCSNWFAGCSYCCHPVADTTLYMRIPLRLLLFFCAFFLWLTAGSCYYPYLLLLLMLVCITAYISCNFLLQKSASILTHACIPIANLFFL